MRRRTCNTARAVLVAGMGAVLLACTPPPVVDASPVAGCHDHVGASGGYDVEYSGEPSEYGNLQYRSSTDGSCAGAIVAGDLASTTLIVTSNQANAQFLCRHLLGSDAVDGTFDDVTGPWNPPFGPLAFRCDG